MLIQDDARTKFQSISALPIRPGGIDKAKLDAKARKRRDEKEAASALESFVKDFDVDVEDTSWSAGGGVEGGMSHSSQGTGHKISMGRMSRRHFSAKVSSMEGS
jgi:hypothetical protein